MNSEKPKDTTLSNSDTAFETRFTAAQDAMGEAADWKDVKDASAEALADARVDGAVGAEVAYHDHQVEHAAMMEDIKRREAEKLADSRSSIRKLTDFVLRRNK